MFSDTGCFSPKWRRISLELLKHPVFFKYFSVILLQITKIMSSFYEKYSRKKKDNFWRISPKPVIPCYISSLDIWVFIKFVVLLVIIRNFLRHSSLYIKKFKCKISSLTSFFSLVFCVIIRIFPKFLRFLFVVLRILSPLFSVVDSFQFSLM